MASKILEAMSKMPCKQTVFPGRVDPTRIEEFAVLVEKLHPNARAHEPGIAGSYVYADGRRSVIFAAEHKDPNWLITCYSTGNAVFSGIEPIELPAEPVE